MLFSLRNQFCSAVATGWANAFFKRIDVNFARACVADVELSQDGFDRDELLGRGHDQHAVRAGVDGELHRNDARVAQASRLAGGGAAAEARLADAEQRGQGVNQMRWRRRF